MQHSLYMLNKTHLFSYVNKLMDNYQIFLPLVKIFIKCYALFENFKKPIHISKGKLIRLTFVIFNNVIIISMLIALVIYFNILIILLQQIHKLR